MYASGGKNVPAGMAVVIVRESWLTSTAVHPMCPQVLDYRKTAGGRMPAPSIFQSLPNTPPIFAAYMLGLVLDATDEPLGLRLASKRFASMPRGKAKVREWQRRVLREI